MYNLQQLCVPQIISTGLMHYWLWSKFKCVILWFLMMMFPAQTLYLYIYLCLIKAVDQLIIQLKCHISHTYDRQDWGKIESLYQSGKSRPNSEWSEEIGAVQTRNMVPQRISLTNSRRRRCFEQITNKQKLLNLTYSTFNLSRLIHIPYSTVSVLSSQPGRVWQQTSQPVFGDGVCR